MTDQLTNLKIIQRNTKQISQNYIAQVEIAQFGGLGVKSKKSQSLRSLGSNLKLSQIS